MSRCACTCYLHELNCYLMNCDGVVSTTSIIGSAKVIVEISKTNIPVYVRLSYMLVCLKAHFIKFIGCNSEVCQFLNEYQLLNKKNLHIFIYPCIVNNFCILQSHVQYLQISCCFQILYTSTFYSCISKHPPPNILLLCKTSYLTLQNTVVYKT